MPSYKRAIILISVVFFVFACSKSSSKVITHDLIYTKEQKENETILHALEYIKIGKREEAINLFSKLYENSLNDEYLLEYIKLNFSLRKYDEIINFVDKNKENIKKHEDKIYKIYALSLIQRKKFSKAENILNDLIEKYDTESNKELLANVYLFQKKYEKAKEIFKKIYLDSLSVSSLLNLTDVMYSYLNEKKEAINYLESHLKLYGCTNTVCSRLLGYYQEQNDIDGVISILKKTYNSFQEMGNEYTLQKVYKLLIYYLEKKDINLVIEFLEQNRIDDKKLLALYQNSNKLEKALDLIKQFYKESGNLDYLAQIAMLEFEIAKDKRKVIKDVVNKLEQVLAVLDNHIYQNYLGYILVDFDLDIKKGIVLVKKALKKVPDNVAYIDSLAWAQYKLGDCTNAKINMKKVISDTGLNDKEIKKHWEKIKECNK